MTSTHRPGVLALAGAVLPALFPAALAAGPGLTPAGPGLTASGPAGLGPSYPPCVPVTLTANDVRGKPPLTLTWTLPGGTVLPGNPVTFDTRLLPAGFHSIVFRATNARGTATALLPLVVETLDFAQPPTATLLPDGRHLFRANTRGATEWRWTWGDGGQTSWLTGCAGSEPTHRFTLPGTFTVRVEARNCRDAGTITTTFTVTVGPGTTLEVLTFQPTCATAPFCAVPVGGTVTFTQLVQGTPDAYLYDWNGDGLDDQAATTPLTTHRYLTPGFFFPRLIVLDGPFVASKSSPYPLAVTGNAADLIFADGFESGGLGAWSASTDETPSPEES